MKPRNQEEKEDARFHITQALNSRGAFLWWDNDSQAIRISFNEVGSPDDILLYGD